MHKKCGEVFSVRRILLVTGIDQRQIQARADGGDAVNPLGHAGTLCQLSDPFGQGRKVLSVQDVVRVDQLLEVVIDKSEEGGGCDAVQ